MSAKAEPNPYRVRLRDRAEDEGFDTIAAYLEECCADSVVRALCTEGCDVEPDELCPHGCPSPLIAGGLI